MRAISIVRICSKVSRSVRGRNRTPHHERHSRFVQAPRRTRRDAPAMTERPIPGFRIVFTIIGVLYALMATSALVRGVSFLRDFGVSEADLASPVLIDFFSFFYQLMAYVGALMVLFGWVTREGRTQIAVSAALSLANVGFGLRDLATSDSPFGNQLYRGDATMVFVLIDFAIAASFGVLALVGWLRSRRDGRAAID